jgi:hypothetical protein
VHRDGYPVTGREGDKDTELVRETVREYVPPAGSEPYEAPDTQPHPAPAPLPDGPDEDDDKSDEDKPDGGRKGKHKG